MNEAEHKALEYAAKLCKAYREENRKLKAIIIVLSVALAVAVIAALEASI